MSAPAEVHYARFNPSEAYQQALREATLLTAEAAVNDYQTRLEALQEILYDTDPLGVLATIAFYSLRGVVGESGVSQKSLVKEIQQHHVELLQALVQCTPAPKWGKNPATPDVIQKVIDTIIPLAQTFQFQRILDSKEFTDQDSTTEKERARRMLEEAVRFHTQGVRNWGYHREVVQIATELYGQLDFEMKETHGFSATELIRVAQAVMSELERRTNEHVQILRESATGKDGKEVFERYLGQFIDSERELNDVLRMAPTGVPKETALALIMGHLDTELRERLTMSVSAVSATSGYTPDVVEKVLKAISVPPGHFVGNDPRYLFLSNPIWTFPGIITPDGFFLPLAQSVFSHIHRIFSELSSKGKLKESLEAARSRFLEQKVAELLKKAFPTARIASGKKWGRGGKIFETDTIVSLDRTLLICEAKSGRLTPEGLRGAPARVQRHVQELILEPSIQSARLEALIYSAQQGDKVDQAIVGELGINYAEIDHVIRLSVSLEDFSIIGASERRMKNAGWIPMDHELAPTIGLADLICIIDILENPLYLIHYLLERKHFQKSLEVIGDELDFLGLYLKTGLNLSVFNGYSGKILVTGMSEALDVFFTSRDAGIDIPKPTLAITPRFRYLLSLLLEKRPRGWMTFGTSLLSCANFDEQRKIERRIDELTKELLKKQMRPIKPLTIMVKPPERRKAWVGFFLYPSSIGDVRQAISAMSNRAVLDPDCELCVVFGLRIDGGRTELKDLSLARK